MGLVDDLMPIRGYGSKQMDSTWRWELDVFDHVNFGKLIEFSSIKKSNFYLILYKNDNLKRTLSFLPIRKNKLQLKKKESSGT